jgi:hypothetical protein
MKVKWRDTVSAWVDLHETAFTMEWGQSRLRYMRFDGDWGFEYDRGGFFVVSRSYVVLLVMAGGLGLLTYGYIRPKRPKFGVCQKCGYDLRATPERCPECGTAVDSDEVSLAPISRQ